MTTYVSGEWPAAGKKFGQLTPEQQRTAVRRAARALQSELAEVLPLAFDDEPDDEHPSDCDGSVTVAEAGFAGQDMTYQCEHPSHARTACAGCGQSIPAGDGDLCGLCEGDPLAGEPAPRCSRTPNCAYPAGHRDGCSYPQ